VYQVRFLASFFFVLMALYCVAAWAFDYVPALGDYSLPLPASKFPIPPLYVCAGFLVLAVFTHPGWQEDDGKSRKKKQR
jgi:hypothetical protein